MHDADPALYGRSFVDVYDSWYGNLDDPGVISAALRSRLRPEAVVVEFGSGTGRLALPLQASGLSVISLDVSVPMLQLADPSTRPVACDMSMVSLKPACADAVLIAYNTFFNVASVELQQRCLIEASRLLRPDGVVVIEGFIAPAGDDGAIFGVSTKPHPVDPNGSLVIITERTNDHDESRITGTHIEVLDDQTICRPWRLTYRSPRQLDVAAAAASLMLSERHADWRGGVFDPQGIRHVSWYQHNT